MRALGRSPNGSASNPDYCSVCEGWAIQAMSEVILLLLIFAGMIYSARWLSARWRNPKRGDAAWKTMSFHGLWLALWATVVVGGAGALVSIFDPYLGVLIYAAFVLLLPAWSCLWFSVGGLYWVSRNSAKIPSQDRWRLRKVLIALLILAIGLAVITWAFLVTLDF
jgi:hypothetical protein